MTTTPVGKSKPPTRKPPPPPRPSSPAPAPTGSKPPNRPPPPVPGRSSKPPSRTPPPVPGSGPPNRPPPPTPPAWQKRQLGLAKATPKEAEVEVGLGTFTKNESTTEHTLGRSGEVNGKKTETEMLAGAGAKRNVDWESSSFDGTTSTSASTSTEGLAGAEAAVKMVKIASKDELRVGIETLARAGAFGRAEQKAAVKRGMASAGFESQASGSLGVEARMIAQAKMDRTGIIPALEAVFEAGIKAGLWVDGSFKATAAFGPLALAVCGEVNAMLGASASVSAKVFASAKDGIGGEFKAEAFAGARAGAKGSAEAGLGPVSIEIGGEVEGLAGAQAAAEGKFSVSLSGVQAKFEASAFAGAKATAKGSGAIKLMGKKILYAEGKISVSAGAGAEAKGEFTFKSGKLAISAEAAAALGLGMGMGAGAEVDFGALGMVILAQVNELSKSSSDPVIKDKSPDYKREPLGDPALAAKKHKIGYDAVYEDFLGYARKKTKQGKGYSRAKGEKLESEEGIKRERVQAIIANVAPLLRGEFPYVETDQGIERAALDAFDGYIKFVSIQHGKIRAWQPEPRQEAKQSREDKRQEEQWRKARDPLLDEIDAYCRKKAGQGANGIKQAQVQTIVTKHWKKLRSAFPAPGEADQVVGFVATEMKARYLDAFTIKDGQITAFTLNEAKTTGLKAAAASDKAGAAQEAGLVALDSKLTAYKAKLLASDSTTIDQPALVKLVNSSTKKIAEHLKGSAGGDALKARLLAGLDGILEDAEVAGGKLVRVTEKAGGLAAARTTQSNADDEAVRLAAVAKFTSALEAYREHKTATGSHGLKLPRVQSLLDKACKPVVEWQRGGRGDEALQHAAEQALGPLLKDIIITQGTVRAFDLDHAAMAGAKQFRKQNGKGLLSGGEEDDNRRRQIVAAAVRGPFSSVADGFSRASAKNPQLRLKHDGLQKLVDRSVKKVRGDANTEAGNEAVADALMQHFPMIKHAKVENLTITELAVNNNFHAAKAGRAAASEKVRAAQDGIARDLAVDRSKLSQALVQAVVNNHKAGLASLPKEDQDTALEMAVTNALKGMLDGPVEIEQGAVKKLPLKAP